MALRRPPVRAKLFQILGIAPNDGYFREFATDQEDVVNSLITEGARNAQYDLVTRSPSRRWRKEWAITATDVEQDNTFARTRYKVTLPSDFMRLDGDAENRPGVLDEAGWPHGQFVEDSMVSPQVGDFYYIQGDQLWFSAGRNPAGLVVRYIYWHPVIDDDTDELDFSDQHLDLVAYYTADQAVTEDWVPDNDVKALRRISLGLTRAFNRACSAERRSRAPVSYNRGSTERSYSSQRML